MMNNIGKTLVLIHVTLSLLALTWAAALLLQFVDWGWTEPRLDVNERVASELDKRVAAVNEAVRSRNMALPALKSSYEAWNAAMNRYAANHLFYRDELERLKTGAGAITAKDFKLEDTGVIKLDEKRIGKPAFDQDLPKLDKSLAEYEKLLTGKDALYAQIAGLENELRDLSAQAEKITKQLNGGMYDLLEGEAQAQARIRFEKDYIQPLWAATIEDANQLMERRDRLQSTLKRLEIDLSKPRGK
jgi:septation ring formation regulator EzrA